MDEDRIRARAYEIWEEQGRPEGRHDEHWQQARAEIEGDGTGAVADAGPVDVSASPAGTDRADRSLGRAAGDLRTADAASPQPGATEEVAAPASVQMEGAGGGSGDERTLGGAGEGGDLITPRP